MAGAEYTKYLQSRHWQAFRLKALRHYGKKCHLCGTKEVPYFHVHHLTYERVGEEKLSDVVVLCEECHNEVHRTGFVIKPVMKKATKKHFVNRRNKGSKAKKKSSQKELLEWFRNSMDKTTPQKDTPPPPPKKKKKKDVTPPLTPLEKRGIIRNF